MGETQLFSPDIAKEVEPDSGAEIEQKEIVSGPLFGATLTVRRGEHVLVPSAMKSIITIEAGGKLTASGSVGKCSIRVEAGGELEMLGPNFHNEIKEE